jgi:sortase A
MWRTVLGVVRTFLRGFGRTCITGGILVLLFVVYQLWGTGFAEARSQHDLKKQFGALTTIPTAPLTTTTTDRPHPTTTAAPLPSPPTGSAVAILNIPRIGLSAAVVEGVGVEDLKKGPGHYPNTPLPGQPGNTAIAGHRTTYGHPFYDLDSVKTGDDIFIATHTAVFHYSVISEQEVLPSDVAVVAPTADNRLTLTTCTPRYSASHRLILQARLIGPATAPPTAPPRAVPPVRTLPDDTPATAAAVVSLSGKGESTLPAIAWAIVCAVIWLGAYLVGRGWRKWPAYLIAAPLFFVALFIFFENFARFVPANV